MTKQHADINLKEDADVKLNLKGLGWLISTCFVIGGLIVGYQMKLDHKIETLYLQNEAAHSALMVKLSEMDNRQQLYALKRQVEDALVFVSRSRDNTHGTNNLVDNELLFRESIRNFLK